MIKELNYKNTNFLNLCRKLENEHINIIAEQRNPNGNCLSDLEKYNHVLLYYIKN